MARIGGQLIPQYTILLMSSEVVLILTALVIATVLRLPATASFWGNLLDNGTLLRLMLVVIICELTFYYHDLYDSEIARSIGRMLIRLLQALGISFIVLGTAYHINAALSLGRGITVMAAPAIIVLVISWRFSLNVVNSHVRGAERVLLAGTTNVGLKLVQELQLKPEFNYQVIGFLSETKKDELISGNFSAPVLGSMTDIEKIAFEHRIDRIILCPSDERAEMPSSQLVRLKFNGIQIEDAYKLYERVTGRIVLEGISSSWFIFSKGFRKSSVTSLLKRTSDIIIASVGIVLALPVLLIVALAIVVEDGFPILFRQQRIGLQGKPFEIFKFRSMRNAAPTVRPSWTEDQDPRVTRTGKYIRRFRLDELPQFFNVLRGDMSVVGPRPEQPFFCSIFENNIPFFGRRHSVRPGITGWAQIKYGYGSSMEDAWRKLELDLFYIKHLSWVLDLAVIFETAKVVIFGRGVR